MAWIISFGNINGAATTNVYRWVKYQIYFTALPDWSLPWNLHLGSTKDKPWYTLGHCIIILYLAIGFFTSLAYFFGLRRSNARKNKGLCNETILSNESVASPEVMNQAAAKREKMIQEEKGMLGLKSLRRRYGEADGGVYATEEEAKTHKGDAFSGFGEFIVDLDE